MFVLAHLSDPHLPTPPGVRPRMLANKRLFGYLSWRLRRSKVHRPEVLAAVIADIKRIRADHLVVTGDLVNIALLAEFAAAAAWLGTLGRAEEVTVIPGNHDAYVAVRPAPAWDRWRPYMTGDAGSDNPRAVEPPAAGAEAFPFVRRRGPLALIGLSTAEPSEPAMAYGHLGSRQLERLAVLLAGLAGEGLFRVVLLHHPPNDSAVPRRKRLRDAAAFRQVISRHGAELVLHGHNHCLHLGSLAGPEGPVAVVGAPSASAAVGDDDARCAQFLLYRIGRTADAWTLAIARRLIDPADLRVRETPLQHLAIPILRRRGCDGTPAASVIAAG